MADQTHSARAAPQDHRRHSISAKIIFLVFLCTFSTEVIVSWIAIQATQAEMRDHVDRDFPATLERSREALRSWLTASTGSLRPLLGNRNLRALAAGRHADPDNLLGTLARFETESHYYDGVAVLSGDGSWSQAGELHPPDDVAEALGLDASGPRRVVLPSEPAVALAVIPITEDEPSGGFLVARYDRSRIDALLEAQRRDTPGTLLLTDATGLVLAGIGDRATGRIESGYAVHQLLAGAGDDPAGGVHEYADRAGVHSLGAIASLPAGDEDEWLLVVEAPFTVVFAPLLSIVTQVLVTDLLILVVFVALAYRVTPRMLRPIEHLSKDARPASRGDRGLMGKLRNSQAELQQANRQLTSQNEELQRANEVLAQLSITDGLTKLHNHRYFQESLTREIKRQSRSRKPLSMLLLDLDDFKALNDRLGHASGDELLARVASIMDTTVRESDLLARYGGEEFVVLTSDTDLDGAVQLAEKIRMAIEQAPHIVNDSLRPVWITVSVGVAQYAGNRRLFFESADRALYRAKDQGKNCVVATREEVLDE